MSRLQIKSLLTFKTVFYVSIISCQGFDFHTSQECEGKLDLQGDNAHFSKVASFYFIILKVNFRSKRVKLNGIENTQTFAPGPSVFFGHTHRFEIRRLTVALSKQRKQNSPVFTPFTPDAAVITMSLHQKFDVTQM